MEQSYLLRLGDNVLERPQHMWLRVALAIHRDDIDAVRETYDLLSRGAYTQASPYAFQRGAREAAPVIVFHTVRGTR